MLPPKQLSKRQLGILMAGWITWHTPDTKSVRPFTVDNSGALTTLSNGERVYPTDDDFQALITCGYIEPIDGSTYMLTKEANDAFKELSTFYFNRSAGADIG